jgi:hypothetical protein
MNREEENRNLSYESDGKMGKENQEEKKIGDDREKEFFNITPGSE